MNRLSLQALTLGLLVVVSGSMQAAKLTPSKAQMVLSGALLIKDAAIIAASGSFYGYSEAVKAVAGTVSDLNKYKVGAGLVATAAAAHWLNKNGYLNSAKVRARAIAKKTIATIKRYPKTTAAIVFAAGLGLGKYFIVKEMEGKEAARMMRNLFAEVDDVHEDLQYVAEMNSAEINAVGGLFGESKSTS